MDELHVLITIVRPNVTEFFPKSIIPVDNDKNEYKIKCFTCYIGAIKEKIRGDVIYIREDIKSDFSH